MEDTKYKKLIIYIDALQPGEEEMSTWVDCTEEVAELKKQLAERDKEIDKFLELIPTLTDKWTQEEIDSADRWANEAYESINSNNNPPDNSE